MTETQEFGVTGLVRKGTYILWILSTDVKLTPTNSWCLTIRVMTECYLSVNGTGSQERPLKKRSRHARVIKERPNAPNAKNVASIPLKPYATAFQRP